VKITRHPGDECRQRQTFGEQDRGDSFGWEHGIRSKGDEGAFPEITTGPPKSRHASSDFSKMDDRTPTAPKPDEPS
jgi:hypothetical protein